MRPVFPMKFLMFIDLTIK